MSGAYIELLPPDRPIFMLGQPIIKLVATGGPGGDLGQLGCCGGRDEYGRDAQNVYYTPFELAQVGMGCCGADEDSHMADASPAAEAKALKNRCDGIETQVAAIMSQVAAASRDQRLTRDQKIAVMASARTQIAALKRDFHDCLDRIKAVVKSARKNARLSVSDQERLGRARAAIARLNRQR